MPSIAAPRAANTPFTLSTEMTPTGDQPQAIADISRRLLDNQRRVCLLGATGTGKTFTMANVIANAGKPALILSHNKTLAAQLYEEFKSLFPENKVGYFVSYYDYYQPEAYIPQRDIYIEKDASRNDDLDRLRLAATSNLLSRRDVIIVASVSCIFGLGSPTAYSEKVVTVQKGQEIDRREFLLALNSMQYQRAEHDFKRGTYRVRGDVIDLYPAYEQFAVRIELFGDEIEAISLINPTSAEVLADESLFHIFPAVHYVMPEDTRAAALRQIKQDLDDRVTELRSQGKLLEAQRLLARTKYDMEMIEEVGFCSGIENYSRYFDGRLPGEAPYTLLDYFSHGPSKDWLLMIDESHVTIPQIRAMYNGDKARKSVLVEHGFRLPAAMDNRPLTFEEFEEAVAQVLFVSATPGPYELEQTGGEIVEQIIRPTGLIDPVVEVRPADGQVPDLLEECKKRAELPIEEGGGRVLVTALTKRLCEDLTNYLDKAGLRVRYLHSEIDTLDRLEILRDLRLGEFDVLVGVNLLREGLDLPEVSLVCILDADKTGFLRGETSLIQTIGRAARNAFGTCIMYADEITEPMQAAIDETNRRREKQLAYNEEHGITPKTVFKEIRRGIEQELRAGKSARQKMQSDEPEYDVHELLSILEEEMMTAAQSLEFEKAANLRDQINAIKDNPAMMSGEEPIRLSDLQASTKSRAKKPGAAGTRAGKRGKRAPRPSSRRKGPKL
jgi:excinuclease ABC subunit B